MSEDLRNKVLDALFGAEEEFDYTSTTTPSPRAGRGSAGVLSRAPRGAPDAVPEGARGRPLVVAGRSGWPAS